MSVKSHIFTAAASLVAGTAIGIGAAALMNRHAEEKTNTPAENRYDVTVTATPADGVLHVRAHTWVGQFAMASVCLRGRVAEPRPCMLEADVAAADGSAKTAFRRGDGVRLDNVAAATGAVLPHTVASDIPAIRPRQDVLQGPLRAKVIRTIDGDTAQALVETFYGHYVLTDVRIGEIDTPESKGRAKCEAEAALAEKAKAETKSLLEGKDVLLYNVKFEKYGGRVLGDFRTQEGVSASENLISKDLAKPYDGGAKASWCNLNK